MGSINTQILPFTPALFIIMLYSPKILPLHICLRTVNKKIHTWSFISWSYLSLVLKLSQSWLFILFVRVRINRTFFLACSVWNTRGVGTGGQVICTEGNSHSSHNQMPRCAFQESTDQETTRLVYTKYIRACVSTCRRTSICPLSFKTQLFTPLNSPLMYWSNSPDVIIRIILDASFWWLMSMRVIQRSAHLSHAAITRKPIDHQHVERGISRRVWRTCKGSIPWYPKQGNAMCDEGNLINNSSQWVGLKGKAKFC